MNIQEIITFIILGLGLSFNGYMIWKKQIIWILHFYHYANVQPIDRKCYCKFMGLGSIICGVACLQYIFFKYLLSFILGEILFFIMLAIGLIFMVYSQLKYNRGII